MFNLNENNRIVMAQHPTDMRKGVNCLRGQVRMVGLDPSNGDVYIFVGKSRQVMKILHWEYGDMLSTTNVLKRYVQIDEVPWNIADRKGQPCRKGYAWQFRDVSPHPRGTFFYYHKGSRGGEIPRTQLMGYQGAIQNDGYKVYNEFENVPGITVLACMAHIRRKFVDAQKSNPLAGEAVKYIATLYALEENLRAAGASADEIRAERKRLAVLILNGIEAWMKTAYMTCAPGEPLAAAIKYALSLWPRVMRYTEEGYYRIDSNPVEQGQRPSVLGRKNYLFSQNDRGAEDNAIFYTNIVSCENLGINPRQWLQDTLQRIWPDMDEPELIRLLPYNYKS